MLTRRGLGLAALWGACLGGTARAAATEAPEALLRQVLAAPGAPVLGNPQGSLTIVEFSDYRCINCHLIRPTIEALLAHDRSARLVVKQWPIYGGPSVYAARVALASAWQGKFPVVNDALWALPAVTRTSVREAAAKSGVDMARLDADLARRSAELGKVLASNDREARALGILGTPGLLIGRYVTAGAITPEAFDALAKRAATAGS